MKIVYLAGGMNSDWQDRVMRRMGDGYHYIDPRSYGSKDEKEYTEWDLEEGVRQCQLVFAYFELDNPSGLGMMLEIGYAAAHGKHIVFVYDQPETRSKYLGMARSVASGVFYSLRDAALYARGLLDG